MTHTVSKIGFLILLLCGLAWAQEKPPTPTLPTPTARKATTPKVTAATDNTPDTPEEVEDSEWPKEFSAGQQKVLIYQPQVDSWDGFNLTAHSAMAVEGSAKDDSIYGVTYFSAHTLVDKESRQADLQDIKITETSFPSDEDQEAKYKDVVQNTFAKKSSTISLDRLEATYTPASNSQTSQVQELKNDPPKFIFSDHPALMVYVDGEPSYQPVAGTNLQRVINTHVLLFKDPSGKFYLHVFNGWMTANGPTDKWTVIKNPPSSVNQALNTAKNGDVDLLVGGNPDDKASLPKLTGSSIPEIYYTTEPTELIVTDGPPNYVPVDGTKLLYIANTTANVFKDLNTQQTYVLTSGRWFSASSTNGPWQYVANNNLPADFASIPDTSDKENVKASVAGTDQAQDALIDNSVPQTAKIVRKEAKLTKANCDGEPEFVAVDRTNLQYAQNCERALIMEDQNTYYTLENGVWFTSASSQGPWVAADKIPDNIYTIPTSHPLHYVTYVRVYDSTPDYIYEGYTPGYYGSYVGAGTVVYGSGYYYHPWVHRYWYGYPLTYGFGVGIGYTPWSGWGWGFGYGWRWSGPTVSVGWGWGAHPYWGPYRGYGYGYYRPGYRWGGYNRSVYNRWGGRAVVRVNSTFHHNGHTYRATTGISYNSHTGTLVAGQHAKVTNAFGNEKPKNGNQNANENRNDRENGNSNNNHGRGNINAPQNVGARANENNTADRPGNHKQPMNLGRQANENRRMNNVYGGRDGVFRSKGNGAWEQRMKGNQWQDVKDTNRIKSLEGERNGRMRGNLRSGRLNRMNGQGLDRGDANEPRGRAGLSGGPRADGAGLGNGGGGRGAGGGGRGGAGGGHGGGGRR